MAIKTVNVAFIPSILKAVSTILSKLVKIMLSSETCNMPSVVHTCLTSIFLKELFSVMESLKIIKSVAV